MKEFQLLVMGIIGIVGFAMFVLSLPITAGYGLYLWSIGTALNVASWMAFKTWCVCFFGGLVLYFCGLVGVGRGVTRV